MKLQLLEIPEATYKKIGELFLLFSHVEWFIANAILLAEHEDTSDYEKAKDLPITQKYFLTLLSQNYARKLETLKQLGFDTGKLKQIGDYRNTISHGLIFRDANTNTLLINKVC